MVSRLLPLILLLPDLLDDGGHFRHDLVGIPILVALADPFDNFPEAIHLTLAVLFELFAVIGVGRHRYPVVVLLGHHGLLCMEIKKV